MKQQNYNNSMENYYDTLPEGYSVDKVIDAKEKKTVIWMNVVGSAMMIAALLLIVLLRRNAIFDLFQTSVNEDTFVFLGKYAIFLVIFFAANIAYMVLHELTHGVVYKVMTHQKLAFGFTGFVAFCGVPNGFVSKKTALCSLLAPFTLFTIILLPLCFVFASGVLTLMFALLFAAHFGGCVGDLYCTILLLTKYDDTVLMNDTGPKQTFYTLKK